MAIEALPRTLPSAQKSTPTPGQANVPSSARARAASTARVKARWAVACAALWVGACGGGGGGEGGSKADLDLIDVSNGFGLLVPHQVFKLGSDGNPSTTLITIRSVADLVDNVRANNSVLPVTAWPGLPSLSNGEEGNHYVAARFSLPLAIKQVIDPSNDGTNGTPLLGPIQVLALDPSTGQTVAVQGRAFIGGRTFGLDDTGTKIVLQKWVGLDPSGKPIALTVNGAQPGLGFPGTESVAFSGGADLLGPGSFVFVVDSDNDLKTHETFPGARQIRLQATTALTSTTGAKLVRNVLGTATVGNDGLPPEVALTAPPNSIPVTSPSFGDSDVDPSTKITVTFTESLQPLSVGSLPTGKPASLSSAISIAFGPVGKQTNVPFTALPRSIYDFSVWELTPGFAFPGSGPSTATCGALNDVTVSFIQQQMEDLSPQANLNNLPASTSFTTGEGPGLVNAPICPDVIYAIRQGSVSGMSVIDLNGFGQSTGNPQYDPNYQSFAKGSSNFANNPNFKLQAQTLRPQLNPPSCTVDGGSAGVFTLTRDSSLNTLLLRSPVITSAGDVMVGQSLDQVFNNGKDVSGCKSTTLGGNLCAITGLQNYSASYPASGPSSHIVPTNDPNSNAQLNANALVGGGNPISWSPHPNPPGLTFPPLCADPYIGGQEPTAFYSAQLILLGGLQLPNLLSPGDPFGDPLNGIPPSGLLVKLQNTWFQGPDVPSKLPGTCLTFSQRQQIGHFLYMTDRARREIVVINSNRMQVIDRIPVSDPTDLAISPNLDFLAVSNQKSNLVQFIDIDPTSSNFHKLVKATTVGAGPRGIAWDPGNEDILVCNEQDNSVSVISAFTFEVRKTVKSQLNKPFDVAITQRQQGFGFLRNVYFGWILNRNGDLAIFESGPSGINGWGFDDVIGVAPMTFNQPKKICVDYKNLGGACWIAHEDPLKADGTSSNLKGGAVSNVIIESTTFGQLPLSVVLGGLFPQFRDLSFKVQTSIGPDQLTGIPVDLALDDQNNFGGLVNFFGNNNPFTSAVPIPMNGKSYVRSTFNSQIQGCKRPTYLFAAVPNSTEGPGVVDVINLEAGSLRFDTDPYVTGVQSIPCSGVSAVIDYWRQ